MHKSNGILITDIVTSGSNMVEMAKNAKLCLQNGGEKENKNNVCPSYTSIYFLYNKYSTEVTVILARRRHGPVVTWNMTAWMWIFFSHISPVPSELLLYSSLQCGILTLGWNNPGMGWQLQSSLPSVPLSACCHIPLTTWNTQAALEILSLEKDKCHYKCCLQGF